MVRRPRLDQRLWLTTLVTLALATAGGGAFAALHLPAPWMSGALVAVTLWVLAGRPAVVPAPLRILTYVVLGASMGGALTPQSLAQASAWPLSMGFLALNVAAVVAACVFYFRRVAGWDLASALYASTPGALSAVMALAESTSADLRKVAFSQGLRLFLLVVGLPNLLNVIGLDAAAPPAAVAAEPMVGLAELLAASAILGLLFDRLHVPGGLLLGAMAASAALHISGLSTAHIPAVLMIPAYVVLGASVGVRFAGTRMDTLKANIIASLGGFAVAMVISAAFSILAALATGEDTGKMLTAFAPGALETMTALGFALGYDPAFMSAHHLFRFVGLSVALPFASHLLVLLSRNERP